MQSPHEADTPVKEFWLISEASQTNVNIIPSTPVQGLLTKSRTFDTRPWATCLRFSANALSWLFKMLRVHLNSGLKGYFFSREWRFWCKSMPKSIAINGLVRAVKLFAGLTVDILVSCPILPAHLKAQTRFLSRQNVWHMIYLRNWSSTMSLVLALSFLQSAF